VATTRGVRLRGTSKTKKGVGEKRTSKKSEDENLGQLYSHGDICAYAQEGRKIYLKREVWNRGAKEGRKRGKNVHQPLNRKRG